MCGIAIAMNGGGGDGQRQQDSNAMRQECAVGPFAQPRDSTTREERAAFG
jgi:hypothetical protein